MRVPHDHHLVGHSDADALLHAIVDALLGAIAEGDIGTWFPNDQEAHRNQDSAEMLDAVFARIKERNYQVVNLDCIVFAQQPKLAEYRDPIRNRLAELLEIDTSQVSFKAKSGELVGPVGRQEAIEAQAIVLLEKRS